MRSLFGKIFLSFILITLVSSITTAAISYYAQIGPYGELKSRLQHLQNRVLVHSLSTVGLAVETILESGDIKDVLMFLRGVDKIGEERLFLVRDDNITFSGQPLPLITEKIVRAARRTGDVQSQISDSEITVALPLPKQDKRNLVIVGTMDRLLWLPAFFPEQKGRDGLLSRQLFHLPLELPLLVMILIAATGCYLLARSLTAPILHLRSAVQKMAEGDFSVRIELPRATGDEIGGLSRDFNTMIKRIETLLRSQKRLLRDISHELRSPLTRLNLSLELARQQPCDVGPYLQRIRKESCRLNDLVDQLLTLTRIEAEVDSVPKEPVNLMQLVEDVVHDANFEAVNLDRRIEIQRHDDVTMYGSMELLGRALENVVRNGLRYTAAGTVVEVNVRRRERDVELTVNDHGPGVQDEYLDQIFKPFFRVARSRDRDSGGTGIGLAIAKQIVLMHGGTIEAENDPAGGLVIRVRFPL